MQTSRCVHSTWHSCSRSGCHISWFSIFSTYFNSFSWLFINNMMEYYQNTYFHCSSLIVYSISHSFIQIIFQALISSIQCLLCHKMKLSKSQVQECKSDPTKALCCICNVQFSIIERKNIGILSFNELINVTGNMSYWGNNKYTTIYRER